MRTGFPSFAMILHAQSYRTATPTPTPTPAPTVGAEYFDLYDDLNTPSGGPTAMTGRTHWSGDLATWATDNGKIHQTALFGGYVRAIMGDTDWVGDFDVTIDYETGASDASGQTWQSSQQDYLAWSIDSSNEVRVTFDTVNHRLQVVAVVAGVSTAHNFYDRYGTAGGTGNVTFLAAGKVRVRMKSGRVKIWVDGTALYPENIYSAPFDSWNLVADSSITSGNQKGKVGARQRNYRWPVMSAIGVRATDIDCSAIDGAVGRKGYSGADALVGTVTYSGTYSGSPVSWVSRLLDATDPDAGPILGSRTGENAQGWKTVTATLGAGTYSIDEDIPLGGPYVIEHGYLDAGGLLHSCFSSTTLVGYRVIVYGQSTAINRGGGSTLNFTPVTAKGGVPMSSYNLLSDYPSGFIANGRNPYVAANQMQSWGFVKPAISIQNVPVIFEAYGVAATGMASLKQGTSNWTAFIAALDTRKGKVEAVLWDQGQNEVNATASTAAANTAAYPAAFNNDIVAPLRTKYGHATMPFFVSIFGNYHNATPPGAPDWATYNANCDAFHRMQYGLTVEGGGSDANVHMSSNHAGIIYADAYHPTGAVTNGNERLAERDAWSIMKALFGTAAHNGRGPIPASATRSGAVVSVAMTMNGASSLLEVTLSTNSGTAVYPTQPGNRHKGWEFSTTSNFASLLAVSSSAVNGTSIDFTLASNPGVPVYCRHLPGADCDDSVLFHGVYSGTAYDRTIPCEPTWSSTNGYVLSST